MIDLTGFSFDMEEDVTEKLEIKESSLQDIAVIGMSICLPGADDIDQFWRSLAEGTDLVIPFPEARKSDVREYAKQIGLNPDDTAFFKGAYLEEIDKFDYKFFRLSPREAGLMNPNQRIFLETAWKTVEDAGYGGDLLKGRKTGVFLGYCADAFHDYKKLIDSVDPSGISIAIPGNLSSVIASRISYLLDLKGPAITVDTACSSSLVAIHLACQALRSGDCDTALAGSVKTLIFPADTGMRIGIESSDGRAKPFHHESDGTGMGEGTAAVFLKPLARAIADGDSIYAVIKGSAVNQDGSSLGISAPNVAAQEEVIDEAWMNAGIAPETIAYIEAHGTGTKLGDPVEIEGIHRAFRRYTARRQFCAVGSVKSNLGHLDNAAGIVGFVKACLALKNKQLPPSLHFNRPNASIDFIESAVYVNRNLADWKDEEYPRRCGVSSFGLSGTNCHVVLEEAPEELPAERFDHIPDSAESEEHLFTLSAQSLSSLSRLIDAYAERLELAGDWSIGDICYTSGAGRGHYSYRLAFVVSSISELKDKIAELQGESLDSIAASPTAVKISSTENMDERSVHEWREIYIRGGDIPWSMLYRNGTHRRVHLPSYPFDKYRCWVENTNLQAAAKPIEDKAIHEIRGAKLTGRADGQYSTLEQLVGNVWANVLGFTELNINEHFYGLGGDSILAFQIAIKLTEAIAKPIEAVDVLRCETVAQLAAHLEQLGVSSKEKLAELTEEQLVHESDAIRNEKYALSSSQLRIFVQEQAGGIGTSYNMPLAFRIKGELNHAGLERALGTLIDRHEALRTTFGMEKGIPVQIIRDSAEFELEHFEAENDAIADVVARFVRPFDIGCAPLFRAGLIRCDLPDEHVLMIDSHHLVSDGFSTAILVKEFFELYQGKKLAPPVYQYRDYVNWREHLEGSEAMDVQESFWRSELMNLGSPASLPLDYQRPSTKTFAGSQIGFCIDEFTSEGLLKAAASNLTTPNVLLLALYGLTILKYADQEEAVIGSIVSGRQRPGQESCVGMFINFIPLRLRTESDWSIQQYIEEAKHFISFCYEHQNVPFERMVDFLKQPVDRSRNPIYDTMLVFHNEYRMTGSDRMSAEGLTFEPIELPTDTATLDVKLDVFLDPKGHLDCKLNYNTDLFEERTMLRFIADFQKIILSFLDEPEQLVEKVKLFNEQEAAEMAQRRKLNDAPVAVSKRIAVNATFTSEPIEGPLRWWAQEFKLPIDVHFGGYNQVFQQLLSPSDQLEGGGGCRVMLVRFEDLIGGVEPDSSDVYDELERQFADLLRIVQAIDKPVPYLFGIFPTATYRRYPDELVGYINQLYERWKQALESLDQIYIVDFREAARSYSVREVFDPVADRAGHMPFSEEFYAVMGTMLARKVISMYSAPFKVIALDCDNTLWQGVCGEDGPLGVKIEAPHLLLQSWMLERAQEGQLLTLCSKNNEVDVWAVFDQHPQMLLKKEHFAHWKINWLPKSDNLKQMAKELNLGIDSFVFIDDNPLECSEVMHNASDVLTLRLPTDIRYMSNFLSHVWAWDRMSITDEDRMRTRLYTEERMRRIEQETSSISLNDFLHGLELKISMRTVGDTEIVRAAQLTQRTNQFNLNGIRRTLEELQQLQMMDNTWCWVIEASDRFGDYGIVGVVIAGSGQEQLRVDSFLLSCRVLGRGIEDAVMSQLKHVAISRGLRGIQLEYRQTNKNDPFRAFLERIGWKAAEHADEDNCEKSGIIPLEKIADSPGYVDMYFETAYEKQCGGDFLLSSSGSEQAGNPSDTALLTASASDIVQTTLEVDPQNIEDGWDPEIHWITAREVRENERHRAYLTAISHSRGDRLTGLAVEDASALQSKSKRQLYEAPKTATELRLADLWMELLGNDAPGANDHFFEIGGNSLKAASLVSKIHQEFGVELTISDLFHEPSLSDMAKLIDVSETSVMGSIALCEARDNYPVLSAQKRLFLLHELQGELDGYNMPGVMLLEGQADLERVEGALQAVIHRHESLRTSFAWVDGEVVQKVHSDVKLKLEVFDQAYEEQLEGLIRAFVRPFRLSEPSLMRAGFIRSVSGKQIVLIDMHHIISDGVSLGNLIHDFARAYRGETLPPLRLQLKDYAVWQQGRFKQGAMNRHRQYWLDLFSSPVPKLNMPVQKNNSSSLNVGAVITFRGERELRRKLTDYALEKGATLFMVLLSAYYVLMSKYTGQEDIVIGTPVAGRIRAELDPLIGMFVNTLALRSFPANDKTFEQYLSEIKDLTLHALRHQEYPFEMLVQELDIQLQPGQNPLFDTMFAMQNMDPFIYEFEDAVLSVFPFDFGVSRFDLTLQARELEDELDFSIEYKTALFSQEVMERLSVHYLRILEQVANRPEAMLKDIHVLDEEERASITDRIRANRSPEFAEFDF
ncbi:FkbH-like protein [Fontibacillus solani]|uniref:FkbH-like protein n=1 Tax=Fontibacillus solani TaxID=1572857 RepID=A0A7W3XTV4_9BACL|nr:HAD-IIIC family phosphatase [Fontibacillus solani]MBA9087964.1 FkbH-like protein [Fontibacillus solani]